MTQRFEPEPYQGFHPGILVVEETHLLLIGAGTRLLAYDLRSVKRLWQDEADTGFWGWERHDDIIFMLAELEFAAWDIHGKKLWTTYVEPPWGFTVRGDQVELDIMGELSTFDARTGR